MAGTFISTRLIILLFCTKIRALDTATQQPATYIKYFLD